MFLQREGSVEEDVVQLLLRVPRRARGGSLMVAGGGANSCFFCFFFEEENGEDGPESFAELLNDLENRPRNNDLVATLRTGRRETQATFRADTVVQGEEHIDIVVVR